MLKHIRKYREHINPPYTFHPKEVYTIIFTAVLLFTIPITIISIIQVRDPNPRAKQVEIFRDNLKKIAREQSLSVLSLNKMAMSQGNTSAVSETTLMSALRQRKDTFLSLMKTDPKDALMIGFSKDVTKKFSSKYQTEIEQETIITGKFEITHLDNFETKKSNNQYFVKNAKGQRIQIYSPDNLDGIKVGSTVRATGFLLEDQILVAGSNLKKVKDSSVLGAASSVSVGVVLFNFQNDTRRPWTLDQIRELTFGSTNSVKSYYEEVSFGKTTITGTVTDWVTVPYNNSSCNIDAWGASAKNLSKIGGYSQLVYVYPYTSACSFGGVADYRNTVFINGAVSVRVFAHEIGHNLGPLYHSNGLSCEDAVGTWVAISPYCSMLEYYDVFDVMGSGVGHMNNFQKGRMGWLTASNTQTVTASGTYDVFPIEKASTGTQALRLIYSRDSRGNPGLYLYLEFRQPFGFDNYNPNAPVVQGITIRRGVEYNSLFGPELLDIRPSTASYSDFIDSSLLVGETLNVAEAGLSIKTLSVSPEKARVEITFGNATCVRSDPTISISPIGQWGIPGQTLTYNMTVTNRDSSACSASSFSITPTLPIGFIQNPTSFTETLLPGGSITKTFSLSSPITAVDGFYNFTQTATNTNSPTYTASTTASYNVNRDIDSDTDGFSDSLEDYLGTNKTRKCPQTPVKNDELVDSWPPDFNDDKVVTLADVVLMGNSYNKSTGQAGFKERYDLNGDGTVNDFDIELLQPVYNTKCQ